MTKATSSKTKTTSAKTATSKSATTKSTKRGAAKSATSTSARPTKASRPATKKTATRKAAAKTTGKPKTSAGGSKKAAPKPKSSASTKTKKPSEKNSVKSATKTAAAKVSPKTASDNAPVDEDDKPKIAPAPMRPALRVAKRAEARRDKNQTFKVDTQIIYPAHGVGHITDIEKQSIADIDVELFVIDFEHEKMKLRVPVAKAAVSGMRNLSTPDQIDAAMELLEGRARVKRTMWSRRAQEYEAKINSGDLISVSEVVRDLYRADDQPEQSYSERQLFEQARERLGREVAAVRNKTLDKAIAEIQQHLEKKEKSAER
jgi:CarD family transcriptional regulator